METVVQYAGRERDGADWITSFDLVAEGAPPKRYWCRFGNPSPESVFEETRFDESSTRFWAYVAYLAGSRIEQRQVNEATGEVLFILDDAAERARGGQNANMVEPQVGQVRWTFGSPPYERDTSQDAFR